MHIGGAHLHSQTGQPSAHAMSASAAASRHAEETRKKLFASAEELDAAATAESAWMIGAWSGSGSGSGSNGGRDGSPDRSNSDDTSRSGERSAGIQSVESRTAANLPAASSTLPELALEQSAQSAIAGAQAIGIGPTTPATGYGIYAAPARVEQIPETRQVSYWA